MTNPPTTHDLLEFYSNAIVHEMIRLDQYDPDTLTETDLAHQVFCERITDRIHLQTLLQRMADVNQGERFAGYLGLQQYRRMMNYESWS